MPLIPRSLQADPAKINLIYQNSQYSTEEDLADAQ
jgi:hypothetical protein